MRGGISVLIVSACVFLSVQERHLLHRSAPDAFEVFGRFPDLVAISDSNNDTIMECLALKRTEFNPKDKTATYVFQFRSFHVAEKKNVTFHVTDGSTPDRFGYYTEDDPEERYVGIIRYTNHINCYVVDGPYHNGEQCVLFVSKGTEDDVPIQCTKEFEDICGVTVKLYSRDLCTEDQQED
ncbi:uncharacterized protein LOC144097433 [Amblyomma americanum]